MTVEEEKQEDPAMTSATSDAKDSTGLDATEVTSENAATNTQVDEEEELLVSRLRYF